MVSKKERSIFNILKKDSYFKNPCLLSDEHLLRDVANLMDWSEYKTFTEAKNQSNTYNANYNNFWKSGKLLPSMRLELRKAYIIILKKWNINL